VSSEKRKKDFYMSIRNLFKNTRIYAVVCLFGIVINGYSQSTITIDVNKAAIVIPKELFGVLMERLGKQWDGGVWVGTNSSIENTNGMRKDVIDGFKECGVGAIEWPGGCAANDYNWSSNKNPSNDVGTDRFMQLCGLVGCEPIIAGQGKSSSASSNLEWVTYINNNSAHPEWTLKYFKIGNEVWGCGGNQTVNTYISNYTANYNKLKDPVNGKKLTIIAGSDQEGNWNWLPTMLNSIGSTIDAVEYHDYIYYPNAISSTNPTTANYWTIMKDVLTGDIHSHLYNNVFPAMNSYDPDKRIKIVLDEWGDWLKDTGDEWMQQVTLMDALSAGSQLNMFVQNADRIGVACLAQGVNVIHSLININTSKVMQKTTTFYVFKLFKPHHTNNAKLAPVTPSKIETVSGGGTNLPAVNVAASVDAGGFVNISFINVDLTATRKITATLASSKTSYMVRSADVITGSAFTSFNDFGAAEQVNIKTLEASNYSINGKTLTATLPAMSVVMLRLMPPDTIPVAERPGSLLNNRADEFSIKVGSRGTVLITSSMNRNTPVTIGLYRADGRILVEGVSTCLQKGNRTMVLGSDQRGDGVYIVRIANADINISEKIVIAR
jgi:alpha-L-arabinofuranosidase